MTTSFDGVRHSNDFNLEPSDPKGLPPAMVIDELRVIRRNAKDAATSYTEAVEAQAAKFHIKKGALKRYIAALEDDSTDEAIEEARDLEKLIDGI